MSEMQSEASLDFQPLIDTDTEDFELTPLTTNFPSPPAHAVRKRRHWLIPLVLLLLIILIGGGIFAYSQFTRPPAVQYTQAAASVGNLAVAVSATGPVQANAVYNLNFAVTGTVKSIDVQVDQHVTAGQVLAKLDSTSLKDAVNQAQQSLSAAQTGVNTAQTNLGNTQNEEAASLNTAYAQEQSALTNCTTSSSSSTKSGAIVVASPTSSPTPTPTKTPVPTPTTAPTPTPNATVTANCEQLAEAQYAQAQAQATASISSASNQITAAQQQVSSAQAQLQTAKDNVASATLTAPHDGTIVAINGLVGQTASSGGSSSSASGSSTSSAFIVLVDASSLNIAAQVNEADIANVQVGQSAQFTVAAYPSQTFRASVTGINTIGQTTSNVVTYTVNMAVDMASLHNARVYPGMTATVNVTTAERIGTLLVPSAALSFSTTAIQNGELTRTALRSLIGGTSATASTGGSSLGSRGIVVELKNGKLVPVLVTTGLTNGQYTEVLSGLKAGDQVIVGQTGGTTTTTTGTGGSTRGGFGGGGFGGGGGGSGRGGSSSGGTGGNGG